MSFIRTEAPIKPSNIRIWIHDSNIKQLSKVIWSGLGEKLLTETSKQPMVNKFLKAVPYILVTFEKKSQDFCTLICLFLLHLSNFIKGHYKRNTQSCN